MRRTVPILAALLLLLPVTLATHNPWPDDMAALGDSITMAANSSGAKLGDHPENSWSTGYSGTDGVTSHYERILASHAGIRNKNFNDAKSGADMTDLAGQAATAVTQGADYVTILMGANDVCKSSIGAMTPLDQFRSEFRAAADKLQAGLPAGAVVYVASVPDIYQLWKIYHNDPKASRVWKSLNICQSMLSTSNTEADRQTVRQRNIDYNTILADESAAYGFAWDGHAVFQYQFTKQDVSTLDYFHPSLTGQANLASVTWGAGPYGR